MKSKFTKFLGVGLTLVMLLSLLVVSSPAPVSAQEPEFQLNIITPEEGTEYTACQNFYVNVAVANEGDMTAQDVGVRLKINGEAEFVAPEPNDAGNPTTSNHNGPSLKIIDEIPGKEVRDVWWELHCTGEGETTITAEIGGEPPLQDSVTIMQVVQPKLEITVIEPVGDELWKCESDNFVVKAEYTNVSDEVLTGLTARLADISGPAQLLDGSPPSEKPIGTLQPGASSIVGWTLHCTGPGDADILLDATGIAAEYVKEVTVTVHQGADLGVLEVIDVTVDTSPFDLGEACINCNYTYTVSATVTNTGCSPVTNVTATLDVDDGNPSIVGALTKSTDPDTINPGETATATWEWTCNDSSTVAFEVDADGVNSAGIAISAASEFSMPINQKGILVVLTAEAVDPNGLFIISTEQYFDVTATVYNCTDDDMYSVNLTLDLNDLDAHITSGQNPYTFPSKVCDCCIVDYTWRIRCDGPGQDYIDVIVQEASDTYTDTDSIEVLQQQKAHLMGGITTFLGVPDMEDPADDDFFTTPTDTFPECNDFMVVVAVKNSGQACAEDVEVTLTVEEMGGSASTTEPLTKTIDVIPGQSAGKVMWEFHCDGEGDVRFWVEDGDLSGIDCNTQKAIPAANIDTICPVTVEQTEVSEAMIDVEIIQPHEGDIFQESDEFTVKAKVRNTGNADLETVQATIVWEGPASLVNEPGPTKSLGDIPIGHTDEVSWVMHCDGSGDVDITVTAVAAVPPVEDSDEITVQQQGPADLIFEILSPECESCFGTGEEFAITAMVLNDSSTSIAENVVAALGDRDGWTGDGIETGFSFDEMCITPGSETIWVDGVEQQRDVDYTINYNLGNVRFEVPPAPGAVIRAVYLCKISLVPGQEMEKSLGNIAPGEHKIVSWTMRVENTCQPGCSSNAEGVELYAWADNAEEVDDWVCYYTYPAANLVVESIEVDPSTTINVCDEFTVTAVITNTGQADAWETEATISFFPADSVRLAEGETGFTKPLGTIVGWGTGDSKVVTWNLHCKEACETVITITPAGNDECGCFCCDMCYAGMEIPEQFIEPASVVVKQLESGGLDLGIHKGVDNSAPDVGETVNYYIRVFNYGPTNASGVNVIESLPVGLSGWNVEEITQGSYSAGTWSVGNLVVDASATLVLSAQVNSDEAIGNEVLVSCDQPDGYPWNNSAFVILNADSFEIALDEDYNLISLPLIPEDSSIEAVLAEITDNVDIVWAYDACGGGWTSYSPGEPSDLTVMEDGPGYWVNMDAPDTLTATGVVIPLPPATPPTYPVCDGWNLIGFKSMFPRQAGDYLAAIDGKYTVIYCYQNGAFILVEPGHSFQPGFGYWIAIKDGESGTIYP